MNKKLKAAIATTVIIVSFGSGFAVCYYFFQRKVISTITETKTVFKYKKQATEPNEYKQCYDSKLFISVFNKYDEMLIVAEDECKRSEKIVVLPREKNILIANAFLYPYTYNNFTSYHAGGEVMYYRQVWKWVCVGGGFAYGKHMWAVKAGVAVKF